MALHHEEEREETERGQKRALLWREEGTRGVSGVIREERKGIMCASSWAAAVFYQGLSPTGGGRRRQLESKHLWLIRRGALRGGAAATVRDNARVFCEVNVLFRLICRDRVILWLEVSIICKPVFLESVKTMVAFARWAVTVHALPEALFTQDYIGPVPVFTKL